LYGYYFDGRKIYDIKLSEGTKFFDTDEIRGAVRARLAAFKVPRYVKSNPDCQLQLKLDSQTKERFIGVPFCML